MGKWSEKLNPQNAQKSFVVPDGCKRRNTKSTFTATVRYAPTRVSNLFSQSKHRFPGFKIINKIWFCFFKIDLGQIHFFRENLRINNETCFTTAHKRFPRKNGFTSRYTYFQNLQDRFKHNAGYCFVIDWSSVRLVGTTEEQIGLHRPSPDRVPNNWVRICTDTNRKLQKVYATLIQEHQVVNLECCYLFFVLFVFVIEKQTKHSNTKGSPATLLEPQFHLSYTNFFPHAVGCVR